MTVEKTKLKQLLRPITTGADSADEPIRIPSNRPFQLVHFVFRPRNATRGNSFFQMSSYARANLRITNEKTKGKFP